MFSVIIVFVCFQLCFSSSSFHANKGSCTKFLLLFIIVFPTEAKWGMIMASMCESFPYLCPEHNLKINKYY